MAYRRGLVPIVIAALIALVYWPGLHGFWTRDDFMQLAFARLVGSPWIVFVQDHYFPAPGSIFRPLGFASFWLSQALFGTDYFWNAFGDLVLHVAVSLALYRVIRAGEIDRAPAALCTLLFALHPAVLGTALWWSARFDLLAMLFGLVAVRASQDHLARPHRGVLLVALIATLAALLSKETALAAAGAVAVVWMRAAWIDHSRRIERLRDVAALAGVVALFFAWRTAVLGTATTRLAGDASIVDAVGRGFVTWLSHLGGYVTFWPRSAAAVAIVLFGYVLIALVEAYIRPGPPQDAKTRSSRMDLVVVAVCLFVLPAIVQAPIAAMNATPLSADVSAVEAAMQSRLYYISIGGLTMLFAAAVGYVWTRALLPRLVPLAALAIPVAAFAWASHSTAVAFARTTAAPRAVAEHVAAAVDRVAANAGERCRVVVLGVEPPPEWSIYVSIDSVAKALTADLDRVGRCFIDADYVTYFNLMHGEANADDALPYTPRSANGRPIPWLRVGDMTATYLDPPANVDAATLAGIVFIRYENGAFVDVTSDVASGRLQVALH